MKSITRPIPIVYITDENYVMPTCISIISLKENRKNEQYKVYVLVSDITEKSKKILCALAESDMEIYIMEVQAEKYSNLAATCLSTGIHVTKSALFKFDLPELLPEDKVLYLDSDVIVNDCLTELFAVNISEYCVAAVDDMCDDICNGQSGLAARIGIKSAHYFNTGVMVLNLKRMREKDVSNRLLEYRQFRQNFFMDQDAFNYVLGNERAFLNYKFNFLASAVNKLPFEEIYGRYCLHDFDSFEECLKSQVIIHLTDAAKPWKYNIPWFTDLFFMYYKKSEYGNYKIQLQSVIYYYLNIYKGFIDQLKKKNERIQKTIERKCWAFPYEKITYQSRIVLYGAGNVGQDFFQQLKRNRYCSVVLWVDERYAEMGRDVRDPNEILDCCYDYVLIASHKRNVIQAIEEYLLKTGIKKEKIVTL